MFTLSGPLVQDFDCPLTFPCVVQLTGTGLASTNKVRVVSSDQICSTSAAMPSGYAGATFATYSLPGGLNTFDLGTATTGEATAGFQLCFAHDSSHLFRVGVFQVSGPLTGATACTLSEACSLQLAGVGLASTNVLRILASSDACGSGAVGVSTFVGLASTTSVSASSPYDVYIVAAAGITGGTSGSIEKSKTVHNIR